MTTGVRTSGKAGPVSRSRQAPYVSSDVTAASAPGTASPRGAVPPAVPAHVLPHRSPTELLILARRGLVEAVVTPADGLRYATAHLAALRAAAAVLTARARPVLRRRGRPTSVWALLAAVAPELAEWAGFFATGAVKRAAAEAGIPHTVTAREADDLTREAGRFVVLVERMFEFTGPPLPVGPEASGATPGTDDPANDPANDPVDGPVGVLAGAPMATCGVGVGAG